MSLTRLIPSLTVLTIAAGLTATPAPARGQSGIVIDTVNLTNLQIVGNVLQADGTVTGTLAGLPFTTDITNFALQLIPDNPNTPAVECSVLDLELGPINLGVLGLFVDTSRICLAITATEGGGLLGDLLCGLAGGGLLGNGIPVLPNANQLGTLEEGLAEILQGALDSDSQANGGDDSVCTGECEILDLALGPIDLSLLGLNVSLDDCEDGPVLVCVSASRGEGLLGDLLCGLTGAQVINLTLEDITTLGERATELSADGSLSRRDAGTLQSLLGRLIRS
jgi:hypothetical protein